MRRDGAHGEQGAPGRTLGGDTGAVSARRPRSPGAVDADPATWLVVALAGVVAAPVGEGRVSAARLTGRALYEAYRVRFEWRHPLPWRALHGYERRVWSSLAADIVEHPQGETH